MVSTILFTRSPHSPGNEVGVACGLCVNKMTDATLSSEDEEIENPIETAVSRGASLVEREKASISRKRKVIVTSHLDSTKGCLICGN